MNRHESYYGCLHTKYQYFNLFYMAFKGRLGRIQRRLTEKEQKSIRPGSVFVYLLSEANIKRWTDGRSWKTSRVCGFSTVYLEKDGSMIKKVVKMEIYNDMLFAISYQDVQNEYTRDCCKIYDELKIDCDLVGSDFQKFIDNGALGVSRCDIGFYLKNKIGKTTKTYGELEKTTEAHDKKGAGSRKIDLKLSTGLHIGAQLEDSETENMERGGSKIYFNARKDMSKPKRYLQATSFDFTVPDFNNDTPNFGISDIAINNIPTSVKNYDNFLKESQPSEKYSNYNTCENNLEVINMGICYQNNFIFNKEHPGHNFSQSINSKISDTKIGEFVYDEQDENFIYNFLDSFPANEEPDPKNEMENRLFGERKHGFLNEYQTNGLNQQKDYKKTTEFKNESPKYNRFENIKTEDNLKSMNQPRSEGIDEFDEMTDDDYF